MCRYFSIRLIDFMFADKTTLTDYTSFFSPYNLKKNNSITFSYLKMNKVRSSQTIDRTNLTDQTKFRLNEKSNTENYFNQ